MKWGITVKSKGFAIGIDIGGTNFRIGAVEEDGKIKNFKKEKVSILFNDRPPIENLKKVIQSFVNETGEGEMKAIAIGFPSTISKDKKMIYSTPNLPGFENINIKDLLQDTFGVPVFIENDVNYLLQYEISSHKWNNPGVVLGFYIGTGYGNAIYINNTFLEGKNGVAAELGHIPVLNGEGKCGCGNEGCIELYASGKRLKEIKDLRFPETEWEDLFTLHADDPEIESFIKTLAIPIATEINILDPDEIVLGGGVLQMEGFPKKKLEHFIYQFARKPYPAENLVIHYAENKSETGVLGAAFYAYERLNKMDISITNEITI